MLVLVVLRRVVTVLVVAALALPVAGGLAAAAPVFRQRALDTRPNPDVVLRGSGWGHGVGMSQYGAYAQSRAGWTFREILQHYYTGITVGTAPLPTDIRVGLSTGLPYSYVDAETGPVAWKVQANGKWYTKRQPQGTSWKVERTAAGRFRLSHGATEIWHVNVSALYADFNWAGRTDGTVIEAYNPNYGGRSRYRWGRLEYTKGAYDSSKLNLVVHIPRLELYLRGLGEMPSSWGTTGGAAALQAQAVVARSYAAVLRQTYEAGCRCHLVATPANQVYLGYDKEGDAYGDVWVDAVRATAGVVAQYQGTPIAAFYSSSHGGRSENIEDSWAYSATVPYVRSVPDAWSAKAPGNSFAAWTRTVGNASFAGFVGGLRNVRSVAIVGRTAGGSPKALRVYGLGSSGRTTGVTRTGPKDVVGIALRSAFSYPAKGLSTLPSQQVRRIGFPPFVDDDGSPHEYRIVYATKARIMDRRSATRFAPTAAVPRSSAALYLYRLLALPLATRDYYDDDNGRTGEHAINAIALAKISGDLAGRTYRPADPLTRGEAATFFRRALQLPATSRDYFTDDGDSIHQGPINAVRAKGLIGGCGGGKFCPDRPLTRAEMATLLYRAVELHR